MVQGTDLGLPDLDDDDDGGGGSGPSPFDWARFVAGAAFRRRKLVGALLLLGFVALVTYYRVRTPMYRVEAKILAQRQQALPSIVRPAGLDEAPTRSAPDFIRRRESLVAMVQQAKLNFARPGASQGPGLVERMLVATGLKSAEADDADPMNAMVQRVDRALQVQVEEGTIIIQVDWPEPNKAFQLAQAALQNFLEGRHLQEVTTIDESISLLEARVETLHGELERAIAETRRNPRATAYDPEASARGLPSLPAQASEELVSLKSMLEAKERAIRDVDEFRRRRLLDLQSQLDAQRTVYSDAHPIIIGLRRDLEALSHESPQIASLREDEKRLRKEYTARIAQEGHSRALAVPVPVARPAPAPSGGTSDEPERVRDARFRYQRMVERMSSAQLELDAARAAFKYRYNVSWPAQVPKEPFSPNARKIFGLGGLAVLLGSLLAAGAVELREGRIVERWQVERVLRIPILGELGPK